MAKTTGPHELLCQWPNDGTKYQSLNAAQLRSMVEPTVHAGLPPLTQDVITELSRHNFKGARISYLRYKAPDGKEIEITINFA